MDDRANVHVLEGTAEEQEREALRRGLVRIPDEEAKAVAAMPLEERKAWLKQRLATDHSKTTLEAKRRLKNKRKAQRRARRVSRG